LEEFITGFGERVVRAMSDDHSQQTSTTAAPRVNSGASESSVPANASGADVAEKPESGRQLDGMERIALQDKVSEVLRTCYDPEIPVNIYELGLIYEVRVEPSAEVYVKMTLTSPSCPAAASLPAEVQEKVKAIPQVAGAKVEVVWDPTWDPSRMTEAARLQLGMF
jgi:FeS assembly SUF system protein